MAWEYETERLLWENLPPRGILRSPEKSASRTVVWEPVEANPFGVSQGQASYCDSDFNFIKIIKKNQNSA